MGLKITRVRPSKVPHWRIEGTIDIGPFLIGATVAAIVWLFISWGN